MKPKMMEQKKKHAKDSFIKHQIPNGYDFDDPGERSAHRDYGHHHHHRSSTSTNHLSISVFNDLLRVLYIFNDFPFLYEIKSTPPRTQHKTKHFAGSFYFKLLMPHIEQWCSCTQFFYRTIWNENKTTINLIIEKTNKQTKSNDEYF